MKLKNAPLLILFILIFTTGCKKKIRSGYYEVSASVGEYIFKRPTGDPFAPFATTTISGGTRTENFSKKRGEQYSATLWSLADSSQTVTLIINVYYDEQLIDSKQITTANQPMIEVSGNIP